MTTAGSKILGQKDPQSDAVQPVSHSNNELEVTILLFVVDFLCFLLLLFVVFLADFFNTEKLRNK